MKFVFWPEWNSHDVVVPNQLLPGHCAWVVIRIHSIDGSMIVLPHLRNSIDRCCGRAKRATQPFWKLHRIHRGRTLSTTIVSRTRIWDGRFTSWTVTIRKAQPNDIRCRHLCLFLT